MTIGKKLNKKYVICDYFFITFVKKIYYDRNLQNN